MNRQKSRRRQRIKLTFTYAVMTISTLALVTVALFITQGYRYNRFSGTIEQGAMVQFDSRPNDASIQVDAAKLANRTATRITVTAGQHTITISKDGFVPWQKQVNAKAGSVLWLNYVKLIPTEITIRDIDELSGLDSALASPDRSRFAVIQNKQKPEVDFIKPSDATAEHKTRQLASDVYETDNVQSHSFTLKQWSYDSKRVLISHNYDSKTEYLLLDLDGNALNITRDLGVSISKLAFDPSDSQVVYVLTQDSAIRRIRLSDKTLSGPIISSVSDFTVSRSGWVNYATKPDSTGQRTVGYLSKGASKPKSLKTFQNMNNRSLSLAIEEYYYDDFALITYGDKVDISKVILPASDASDNVKQELVTTMSLASDVDYTGFSPNEYRYVYAQAGDDIVTYNLELSAIAKVAFKGSVGDRPLAWLDNSHVVNVGNSLELADYDGTNLHTIAKDATGGAALHTTNNRFIYYFRKQSSGKITLSYVKLY